MTKNVPLPPPPPPPAKVLSSPPPPPPPHPTVPDLDTYPDKVHSQIPVPQTPPHPCSVNKNYESLPVQSPPRSPVLTGTAPIHNVTAETTVDATAGKAHPKNEPLEFKPKRSPTSEPTGVPDTACEGLVVSDPSPPTPPTATTTTIATQTTSRFEFHSDTKAPVQLSQLEQQTAQNITSFRLKLNQIDKQIAKWNANFANEVVDRDKDLVGMLDYVCVDPLERFSERFFDRLEDSMGSLWGKSKDYSTSKNNHYSLNNSMKHNNNNDLSKENNGDNVNIIKESEIDLKHNNDEKKVEGVQDRDDDEGIVEETQKEPRKDQTNNSISISNEIKEELTTNTNHGNNITKPSIQSLSSKISSLSSNLNHYTHVTIPTQIHSFQKEITTKNTTLSNVQLEVLKAKKSEQSIISKFESMAGLTKKSFVQEKATTHAELTLLKEEVNVAGGYDKYRTSRFLKKIQDIRNMLEMEREERRKKDELVLERIVETKELLQKTLLDAYLKYDE